MKKVQQSGMWFNRLNWDRKGHGQWHWYWKSFTAGPYASHRLMKQGFDQWLRKFKKDNAEMISKGYVNLKEIY